MKPKLILRQQQGISSTGQNHNREKKSYIVVKPEGKNPGEGQPVAPDQILS